MDRAGRWASLYGGGATGKSLLALLLGHAMAAGTAWLGLKTAEPGSSLYVSCEDDEDELHRRHADIRKGLGGMIGNPFAAARFVDRVGHNNLLATGDGKGGLMAGPYLAELRAELEHTRPTLVILDTLADVYGGNEIDRVQVNGFLKTCLGGLIVERKQQGHDLTVLLLVTRRNRAWRDGTGFSGSTAWENGVRSRLYLSRPENAGPDDRILTRAKANYAGGDDGDLALISRARIFEAVDPVTGWASGNTQMAKTVEHEVAFAWDMGSPYVEKRGHARNLHGAIVKRLVNERQPRGLVLAGLRQAIDEGADRAFQEHRQARLEDPGMTPKAFIIACVKFANENSQLELLCAFNAFECKRRTA